MRKKQQIWLWLIVVTGGLFIVGCAQLAPIQAPAIEEARATESEAAPDEPQEEVTTTEEGVAADAPETTLIEEVTLLPAESPPFSTSGWTTDFSKRTVEWSQILSGGPPKDGIPSIDEPVFVAIEDSQNRVSAKEPVIVFEHNDDARAYPLSILMWHEIVNDEVGGKPVTVTFCPLCNASIVFEREFNGQILDFGTTGRLRNSDLVMYDRQSETWWQQFSGQGLIGEYAGQQLGFLPSQVLSFEDFSALYPDGQVLGVGGDSMRNYGVNPYRGYDDQDANTDPFLFDGVIDPRLPAVERVVGLDFGDATMAYAFGDVADAGAINDEVAGVPLVVWHKDGTTSALGGAVIADNRDIGSVGAFSRQVGDQILTFVATGDGTFSDNETGTTWLINGLATDGELAGTQLETILSFDHFWFAWAAFNPETGLWEG